MTAPVATSAIKTNRTNVVGAGLQLKSRIDFKSIGLSPIAADEIEKQIEREFSLWAESKLCDTTGLNDFYELQQIAIMSWLINGDNFALITREKPLPYLPYGLRIHLIEGDRVCNPNSMGDRVDLRLKAANGNRIYNGVEIDQRGLVVAYHICSSHPNSNLELQKSWTRVEARGAKTGLANVLHVMDAERPEQYRGVPYLAPVVESLKQLTRYTEAELMAAVINSFFTVFVKVSGPADGQSDFGGIGEPNDDLPLLDYKMGPGAINFLQEGESIEIADAKRPNVNFDGFVSSMTKYIGAALEIPIELLTKSFTSSYSASRAALLEAWKAFRMRRTWFANDFCQPIYEIWLSEAVARGRVEAPGFFNDPLIRKAYCRAEWNGPAPGMLNPVQEVDAATRRVAQGFSTRERETIEMNGGNFDRNVEQLILENEKMRATGGGETR